ncbi:MAG TPA: hypothetical protein VLD55_13865, partial [Candidatus Sulfobium mesophilum]|nr:hypothetical protein [Candidatus Sulfobium mesophilum]
FHNAAQLALAYVLFIQRIEAMYIISPVIILLGTITGVANGAVSGLLINKLLKKEDDRIQNDSAEKSHML